MVNFPIMGPFREPILFLEAVVVLLAMEFGTLFLYRFFKRDREKIMIFAWGLFFFCFAGTIMVYIYADLFTPPTRQMFINIGYIILGLGALIFTFSAEHEVRHRYYLFSLILLTAFCLLIIDFFFVFIEPVYLTLVCWAPFVVILLVYIIKLMIRIKEYRLKIYGFLIGFVVLVFGYVATTDMMQNLGSLPFLSRLIGDISLISGMSLISLIFVGLPSLKELDWGKKLNKILLLNTSGACICDFDFKEISLVEDTGAASMQFMAGGLIGISQMIMEIIHSKARLEVMSHQDKQIIFAYGKYLIAALIVDDYLKIYKKKLYHMLEEIELIYGDLLTTGKLAYLKPLEKIITRTFS